MANPTSILVCLHKDASIHPSNDLRSQAIMRGPEWDHGIPDESTQLDEATLLRITRGEERALILEAIRIKKTNLFAKVYKQVLQHNGVEFSNDFTDPSKPLTTFEVSNMLTFQEKTCQYFNTYTRYFIKYDRNKFSVKMQDVVYGSCPGCYRAMPLGMKCPACPRHRAKYIYAATDETEAATLQMDYQQLQWSAMSPLDPIRVSEIYMDLKPIYTMNYQKFLDEANYGGKPAHENYEVVSQEDLVRMVYQSGQRNQFLTAPVEFMLQVRDIQEWYVLRAVETMLTPIVPALALPQEHQDALSAAMSRYQEGFLPPGVAEPSQIQNEDLEEDLFY